MYNNSYEEILSIDKNSYEFIFLIDTVFVNMLLSNIKLSKWKVFHVCRSLEVLK